MSKSEETDFTVQEKIDYQVFSNQNLSREQLRAWFVKDIKGVYILLSELLNTTEAIDALTDVYYKRYKDFHEAQKNQPELPLNYKHNG